MEDIGEMVAKTNHLSFNRTELLLTQREIPSNGFKTDIPHFISKEEWPPSSPDLNPLDFSLWSILESNTCAKSHKNIESLKKSLTEEWAKIPHQTMRTAVRSVPETSEGCRQKFRRVYRTII